MKLINNSFIIIQLILPFGKKIRNEFPLSYSSRLLLHQISYLNRLFMAILSFTAIDSNLITAGLIRILSYFH